MTVREAGVADAPAIAAIYAAAAESSHATFDLEGRPVGWWEAVLAGPEYECLVAVDADADVVLGYARTSRHKEKPAYATTVETSVYVTDAARGRGVGRALYATLLERLDAGPRLLAVAGVALPNDASERLHRAHGFTEVGTFHSVGVKFGREWDVRWYERPLRRR
jgi:phosphinothricin acetyltransferase